MSISCNKVFNFIWIFVPGIQHFVVSSDIYSILIIKTKEIIKNIRKDCSETLQRFQNQHHHHNELNSLYWNRTLCNWPIKHFYVFLILSIDLIWFIQLSYQFEICPKNREKIERRSWNGNKKHKIYDYIGFLWFKKNKYYYFTSHSVDPWVSVYCAFHAGLKLEQSLVTIANL